MTSEIAQRVEQLRDNTVAGAADLAIAAIDIALDARDQWPELAREFQSMHPAIVTVANVGRLLETPAPDLTALRQSLLDGNRRIASRLALLLPPDFQVVTISHSSTVERALAGRPGGNLCCLESLPGGEGRTLAQRLGATVLPDAAMAQAVERADCALVGIDAFDQDGAILHKVGTLPLALCCAHFRKPIYAAGHSFKLAPGSTAELLAAAGDFPGFDRTPPELITAIITERGRFERGRFPEEF